MTGEGGKSEEERRRRSEGRRTKDKEKLHVSRTEVLNHWIHRDEADRNHDLGILSPKKHNFSTYSPSLNVTSVFSIGANPVVFHVVAH